MALVEVLTVFPDGIAASLVHIVPQKVTARAQLHVGHGIHRLVRKLEAVIIAAHHPAAHLAAGVWAGLMLVFGPEVVGAYYAVFMVVLIDILFRCRVLALVGVEQPGPVGVAAPEGQHGVRGGGVPPAGAGVEHRAKAALRGKLLEPEQISLTLVAAKGPLVGDARGHLPGRGGGHILVVYLHPDYRPAVPEEQSLHLPGDLRV